MLCEIINRVENVPELQSRLRLHCLDGLLGSPESCFHVTISQKLYTIVLRVRFQNKRVADNLLYKLVIHIISIPECTEHIEITLFRWFSTVSRVLFSSNNFTKIHKKGEKLKKLHFLHVSFAS